MCWGIVGSVIVGVPKESLAGERRVALSPDAVSQLVKSNISVQVEHDAGLGAGFTDTAYTTAGAKIVGDARAATADADLVLRVSPPTVGEVGALKRGSSHISFLFPTSNADVVAALTEAGINAFAMELMPRITRAQSMDALSAMSSIAGYKAALLAAEALPKFFPMLMTAAGTIPAAKVFVIGAGVAGLQAIATCKRLGAQVEAFDVRPAAKEQVESCGGRFVGMSLLAEEAEDSGGYAKEVSADTHAKELDLIASRLPKTDVVITTALIPGKKAPILITRDMLAKMQTGSVVVDLAAPAGGNCEATIPGQNVVENGVTVLGPLNLLSSMAGDASRMYSKNITEFLKLLMPNAAIEINMEDEIIKATLVTSDGKIPHEPTRLSLEHGSGA